MVYDTGSATQYYQWFSAFTAVGSVHTAKSNAAYLAIPPGGSRYFGYCARYHGASVAPVVKSVTAP